MTESTANAISAYSTLAIAFLTLIYVGVSWFTLRKISKQAEIAEKAADAALLNARAVINAERARLAIDVEMSPFLGDLAVRDGEMVANFNLTCINVGKTPAWIYDVVVDLQCLMVIPDYPKFSEAAEVHSKPRTLQPSERDPKGFSQAYSLLCKGEWGFDKQIVICGSVKFRDVFEKNGRSTFGYTIRADGKNVDRIDDLPAYNRNTYED